MKSQYFKIIGLIFLTICIIGIFFFTRRTASAPELILFYGDTCSHCLKVDEFIKENKVEEKIKINRKEVFNNQANANLMGAKAQECKLDTSQGMGVPFLWDGEKCYIGDEDVIKFFSEKIK